MLAVRATRLFDGVNATLMQRPMLLIERGVIVAVEFGALEPPAGAEIIDLGDSTLLPGLIDVHVHLGFDAGADPVARMRADDDATLLLRMAAHARRMLATGITTARDLGDRGYLGVRLRDWYRAGLQARLGGASDADALAGELGPELVVAGPPVTITGGHCFFMGGEADGELEVRRGVRARVKAGVDVIKVMATGGHMTAGTNPLAPQYSVAELAAAVEEAHRLGRLLTAHAHGAAGISRAVEAGVDGIEHCSFQVEGGVRCDQSVVDRIAAQRIAVCPTTGPTWERPAAPELEARRNDRLACLARLHRAGALIVAGTDAGISGVPHDSLPAGIRVLTRAGLSNAEALTAATSRAAAACGLATRKGALKAGYDADVLAVQGDPLADLHGLEQVRAVFRAGLPLPRDGAR